jgi:hypothetical protein
MGISANMLPTLSLVLDWNGDNRGEGENVGVGDVGDGVIDRRNEVCCGDDDVRTGLGLPRKGIYNLSFGA